MDNICEYSSILNNNKAQARPSRGIMATRVKSQLVSSKNNRSYNAEMR